MNLILLESDNPRPLLPPDDRRARHIREVLRKTVGDSLLVGVVGGSRATARIVADDGAGIGLDIDWSRDPLPPAPVLPVTLLVGLPRPQTARKVLQECTSLGVSALWFVRGELGERSYETSKLWTTGEWQRLQLQGAEQACSTWLPPVRHFPWLGKAIEAVAADLPDADRVALHPPDEAGQPLARWRPGASHTLLAIGPERGWTDRELAALAAGGFVRAHLGARILRSETACTAALTLLAAAHGCLDGPSTK